MATNCFGKADRSRPRISPMVGAARMTSPDTTDAAIRRRFFEATRALPVAARGHGGDGRLVLIARENQEQRHVQVRRDAAVGCVVSSKFRVRSLDWVHQQAVGLIQKAGPVLQHVPPEHLAMRVRLWWPQAHPLL